MVLGAGIADDETNFPAVRNTIGLPLARQYEGASLDRWS
jgi:hypothetical protein